MVRHQLPLHRSGDRSEHPSSRCTRRRSSPSSKRLFDLGITARPVIIGPITFLLLSKAVDGAGAPIERLDELVPLYSDLLGRLADEGVAWVQIDEPVLVTDISADAATLAERTYGTLGALDNRPAIHVATYFGDLGATPGRSGPHTRRGDRCRPGLRCRHRDCAGVIAARRWWPALSTVATSGAPIWKSALGTLTGLLE